MVRQGPVASTLGGGTAGSSRVVDKSPIVNPHLGTQARGTGLTAVAVQEDNSDVIEVRLAGGSRVLEVLLNQKVLSFTEQNWMDLKGK
jgi:hypothetical protein